MTFPPLVVTEEFIRATEDALRVQSLAFSA
jgi:hypothetical protein